MGHIIDASLGSLRPSRPSSSRPWIQQMFGSDGVFCLSSVCGNSYRERAAILFSSTHAHIFSAKTTARKLITVPTLFVVTFLCHLYATMVVFCARRALFFEDRRSTSPTKNGGWQRECTILIPLQNSHHHASSATRCTEWFSLFAVPTTTTTTTRQSSAATLYCRGGSHATF